MAPELERGPDASGHFGRFGGRFVPETLMSPLAELEAAYDEARADERFQADLERLRSSELHGVPSAREDRDEVERAAGRDIRGTDRRLCRHVHA